MNPEKELDKTKPDLVDYTKNVYADLKRQTTPFFTAGKFTYAGGYYNPTYTVTFNKKDYLNYLNNFPDIEIYFWVDWSKQKNMAVWLRP